MSKRAETVFLFTWFLIFPVFAFFVWNIFLGYFPEMMSSENNKMWVLITMVIFWLVPTLNMYGDIGRPVRVVSDDDEDPPICARIIASTEPPGIKMSCVTELPKIPEASTDLALTNPDGRNEDFIKSRVVYTERLSSMVVDERIVVQIIVTVPNPREFQKLAEWGWEEQTS